MTNSLTSDRYIYQSSGNYKVKGKYLDSIEGAVNMTNQNIEELAIRQRGFRLETFLPKRKAWIQTLILLPFGLPVGNFLGASWHFSVNSIVKEHQYLIGVLSMAVNLLLPSLFFAFLFHWGWFIWHQSAARWYPNVQALWAGAYATTTIAISFGSIGLFTHSLGICGNPAWGSIGETLLCNLDGYGFEAKSWFGAWFIIAAYCYQAQDAISRDGHRSNQHNRLSRNDLSDYTITTQGDLSSSDDFPATSITPIATHTQD
ncbi:hypothetical protein [Chamaesiphon sp.]|uniref:hypothetical protein n=1 Tax=Chamaesiphon sp. TaxID=2814140 RepID=UPI0035946E10